MMRERCSFFAASIATFIFVSALAVTSADARDNSVRFDFDGDGKSDIAVYRPGIWTPTVRGSSYFFIRSSLTGEHMAIPFGAGGDRPAVADYDLDGICDLAVFRSWEDTLKVPWDASDYWIRNSSTGTTEVIYHQGYGTVVNRNFVEGPRPELGVYNYRVQGDPSDPCYIEGFLLGSGINLFQKDISQECLGGTISRVPALGDYNNDGYSDVAIFVRDTVGQRGSYFQIWPSPFVAGYNEPPIIRRFDVEVPTPGDYDGDGKTDLAGGIIKYNHFYWKIEFSSNGQIWEFPHGAPGDIPVPADYDGDGKTDPTVYRPSEQNWYIFRTSDWNWEIHQFGLPTDVLIQRPNSF